MVIDVEHRTLVRHFLRSAFRNLTLPVAFTFHEEFMEAKMGRGILLWLLGVPIPVIILLWLFFGR